MISSFFYKNRKFRFFIVIIAFNLALLLIDIANSPIRKGILGEELRVQTKLNFPLEEVSGITQKRLDENHMEIFFVGDRYAKFGSAILDLTSFSLSQQKQFDFSKQIIDRFSMCTNEEIPGCRSLIRDITSQWEGMAMDYSGRFFFLQEQLATIIGLSPNGDIEQVINLDFFPPTKIKKISKKKSASSEKNGLGEGFILLENGHILLAKEKKKPALIEFGPPEEEPIGFIPLQEGKTFKIASKKSYVPLYTWEMPKTERHCDISEISVDEMKQLYLLSQQCGFIGKINALIPEGSQFSMARKWSLPKDIRFAEAFSVLKPEQIFLVAEDFKSEEVKNITILHAQNALLSKK